MAASSGNPDCVKLLIDKGASVETWDAKKKVTPLHCAANKGHLSCLRILLRHGADVNAGLYARSPLLLAVESSAVDCVRELLEYGAIPHSPQVRTDLLITYIKPQVLF